MPDERDDLVKINEGYYAVGDALKMTDWLAQVMYIVGEGWDIEKVIENLKGATRALGTKAQAQYAELQSGDKGQARLSLDDAKPFLDPYPDDVQMQYVLRTGDALFAAVDGPNVAAIVLCEGLDMLCERRTRHVV